MKKAIVSVAVLVAVMHVIFASSVKAQAFSYRSGFENLSEVFGWTLVNGNEANKWCIGQATACGGTSSLYVSSNGGRSSSYIRSASVVYAYYDFVTEAGMLNVAFDHTFGGDDEADCVRAIIMPLQQANPQAGILLDSIYNNTIPQNWHLLCGTYISTNENGGVRFPENLDWYHNEDEFYIRAGSYRLLFLWVNDNSGSSNESVAIDNICIDVNPCTRPGPLYISDVTEKGNFRKEQEWVL